MHPHLKREKEFEEKLLGKMSASELEEKIKEKQKEYADLLTREGALYILAKENSLVGEDAKKDCLTRDLQEGMRGVRMKLKVKKIYPSRSFEKNGRKGSVCRALVADEEGDEVTLVLWNEDAQLAENGELEAGDSIEVHSAMVKDGEVQASGKGGLHVKKLRVPQKISELKDKNAFDLALVRILEFYGVKEYSQKGEDKKKKMVSALASDESGTTRIVFWENSVREAENLSAGDVVKLENGFFKNGEIHVGNKSIVSINPKGKQPLTRVKDLRIGVKTAVRGIVEEVNANDDVELLNVVLNDGGKKITAVFSREKALELLGVKQLASDIKLSTVVELKKELLLEKTVSLLGKAEETQAGLALIVEKTL